MNGLPGLAETVGQQLARCGLSLGTPILVAGERGPFLVRGVSRDGSLVAYRAGGTGGARNFRPEWCVSTTRLGKNGKPVRVRTVPAGARAARAAWQARQHSVGQ
jgi:hypothetical protein